MAGFDGFEEVDWHDTLAELRLLVARSGFAEWDAATAAALEEEDDAEREGARARLQFYTWSFVRFLKVRSTYNLERMRAQMSELVTDGDGNAITGAVLIDADRQPVSILEPDSSDALMESVSAFAAAIGGDGGYFDLEPERR